MFPSIGLRLAARFISPILSSARPTLSRHLFVSHFQTRSFLTTSPLAQAAAVTATRTVRKPFIKTKSSTRKKRPAVKTALKTALKKTPAKEKTKKRVKKKPVERVVVPRVPPMRPINGFGAFIKERNATLPKALTRLAMTQRFKDYGAEWRALPEHERQAYTERSLPSRLKWAEDRSNWFKTIDPKVLKEINRRKKAQGKYVIRGPKRVPRRAPGPFLFFLAQFKKTNSMIGESIPAISKRAGVAWHALSDSQKEPYHKMHDEAAANLAASHVE